jgi:hypothetical protein
MVDGDRVYGLEIVVHRVDDFVELLRPPNVGAH